MGNEHKYQNIMKVLSNSRETINKCMLIVLDFLKSEVLFSSSHLDECSLFPSIVELITCLQIPSISNYSS
jgi:hypothetical protein